MNPPIRNILGLTAALIAGTTLVACNRGGGGGTVGGGDTLATFNGERISKDDYYRYMERLSRIRVNSNQGVVPATVAGNTVGFQVLDDMVRREALLQISKEEGLYPTDADIEKELQFESTKSPDFLKRLTGQGLSIDTIKQELRLKVAEERLVTKGIKVSDAEVDRYIKASPKKFREPKRVLLRMIVVRSPEKKKQVDDALASNQAFQTVAMQYSEAPGARANDARFTTDLYDSFSPALKKLVDSTSEGRASTWVKDPGGQELKFYVERKTPARNVEITPVIKEMVKRELARARGERGSDLSKKLQAKILAAKGDIQDKAMSENWKKAIETLKSSDPTRAAADATASAR